MKGESLYVILNVGRKGRLIHVLTSLIMDEYRQSQNRDAYAHSVTYNISYVQRKAVEKQMEKEWKRKRRTEKREEQEIERK